MLKVELSLLITVYSTTVQHVINVFLFRICKVTVARGKKYSIFVRIEVE